MRREENSKNPWLILGCAWLLGLGMYLPIFCIPPMEYILQSQLNVDHAQMSLLFTIPFLTLAVIAIPSGFLADTIGIRKAAGIGAIVVVIGSLLRGVSTNFTNLTVFTSIYGIGFALIYPNLPKLVGTWFPREKAGLATGIYATALTIGPALALAITLPVIYLLTDTFQGTIWLWSIPALIAAVLWWIVVRNHPVATDQIQQVDGKNKLFAPVWKNGNLWLVGLMFFFLNIQYYTWSAWTPALLMQKGASPELSAAITSVRSWAGIPFIFLLPWISYKVGLRKPFIWSSTIITALASWSAMYISVPLFWPLMVVLALGGGTAFAMILALPVELASKESVGAASGMVLSIGYIGAAAGPWIAGRILDATENLNLAIIMLIGVAVVWTGIAFIIPETGLKARKESTRP
jgi:CP family cyanate transporter-like MFS transporter